MYRKLIPLAGLALAACGAAVPPEPSDAVVRRFTNELERKAEAKDSAVTAAADERADVRADTAAQRVAMPGEGE